MAKRTQMNNLPIPLCIFWYQEKMNLHIQTSSSHTHRVTLWNNHLYPLYSAWLQQLLCVFFTIEPWCRPTLRFC